MERQELHGDNGEDSLQAVDRVGHGDVLVRMLLSDFVIFGANKDGTSLAEVKRSQKQRKDLSIDG